MISRIVRGLIRGMVRSGRGNGGSRRDHPSGKGPFDGRREGRRDRYDGKR